jgi:hypothetical protein
MTTPSRSRLALLSAAIAVLSGACSLEHQTNVLSPSAPSTPAAPASPQAPAGNANYVGSWSSDGIAIPSASACTGFQWNITDQSAASMTGDFSVTCGIVKISGDASGQLTGNQVALAVNGTAVYPGLPACPFSLTGTGTLVDSNTLSIPYTGTTCMGPVHGTETLKKKTTAPPPPPAPVPPPPPPPTAPDPLLGCGGLEADKQALVTCIHDRLDAPHTPQGAFDITRRVAWALRGEGGGLLIKNAGDNIVSWQGYSFSAGRICYPDGHIFKVLSDVPTTNGPIWLDNGMVDPGLYVPAIDPNLPL